MTADEARDVLIEGMNYAAYKETDSSLYDWDKNRLFGSDHYRSGRLVVTPSPWSETDFERKMAQLMGIATRLNRSDPRFAEAQSMLRDENSVLGKIIRLSIRF